MSRAKAVRAVKVTLVEQMMEHAKEVQPELWERTEAIARIINPGCFLDNWITTHDVSEITKVRLKYDQACALEKAQEILRYLGVNTETDWPEILDRFHESNTGMPSVEISPIAPKGAKL